MSDQPPEARMGNDIARQFAHLPQAEAAATAFAYRHKLV